MNLHNSQQMSIKAYTLLISLKLEALSVLVRDAEANI